MHNKILIFYLLLLENLNFTLPILVSSRRQISENEEIHYEVWKERNADLVPKVMMNLFYQNDKNKSSQFGNPNLDLVVRSFTNKTEVKYENSAMLILDFGLNVLSKNEKLQSAQLTLKFTSRLNLSTNMKLKQNKRTRITGFFINGLFEKIKISKDLSAFELDVTKPIENFIKCKKNTNNQHSHFNLKLYLENKLRFATMDQFTPMVEAILIVYSKTNPVIEHELEMAELIQHEEEVILGIQRHREKRSSLNEIPIVSGIAPLSQSDDYEEMEEFNNDINRNLVISNKLGIHGKQLNAHIRRHLAKKMWGPCRKRPFYVDFSEVKFDSWIIAPKGYQAYECYGRCGYPLGAHLTPTKHAIMRALLNGISPKKATRACCVPTKLEPISLLYMDENGVITYKYNYDDMIVADCGCR